MLKLGIEPDPFRLAPDAGLVRCRISTCLAIMHGEERLAMALADNDIHIDIDIYNG